VEPIPLGSLTTWFSIACWVTVGVTFLAALLRTKALQLFGAAGFVFVMFFASVGVSLETGPPASMAHFPAQDLALLGLLWLTWGERAQAWKWVVGLILLGQLGLHAGYWALYVGGDTTKATLRWYIRLNNSGMAAILASMTITGGLHVWQCRGDLVDLLRRLPVLRRRAWASDQGVET